jgi:hypothetical protein
MVPSCYVTGSIRFAFLGAVDSKSCPSHVAGIAELCRNPPSVVFSMTEATRCFKFERFAAMCLRNALLFDSTRNGR